MIRPFFRNRKSFPSYLVSLNTQVESISVTTIQNNMSEQWKIEKEHIMKLTLTERRKMYKSQDYVPLSAVQPWSQYARQVDQTARRPTEADYADCQFKVDAQLNKQVAERVAIFKGDITKLEIDAIVNAANAQLRPGGGVDGAIHRAAGPRLADECRSIGRCDTGQAVLMGGYNLPAKYVIATVGPMDKSAEKLNQCYASVLRLLSEHDIKSVAFPCISTGIYGFPNRQAAHIALANARRHVEADVKSENRVEKIVFCLFMPVDIEIYEALMQLYFPIQ